MVQKAKYPLIDTPTEISRAFMSHKSKPCVVELKVKYFSETGPIFHRLWIKPGWEQSDIWQAAYKWINKDAAEMYYDGSEIEYVSFNSFKLV